MRAARRPGPLRETAPREPEHIASVLLNTGAGGGRAAQAVTLRQIREAFARHGWATEITCIPAQRFAAEAPLRVRDARGVVVAAGGDGTVNVVANACRAHRRPLGMLPLGHANLAVRALGVRPDVDAAAAAIALGRPVDLRHADLNGRLFLSSALFGLYPALLAARQGRGASPRLPGRMTALATGLRTFARSNAPFEAVLEAGIDAGAAAIGDRVRSTTLQVSVNIAPATPADADAAGCIARGELLLTGLADPARWPTLGALLGAAFGADDTARGTVAACASRIVVHTRRRQVPVLLDGDLRVMEPPLEFRVRDAGLQVVRSDGPYGPAADGQ
jgi:diacylglycerol kinase family enzyme